MSIHDRVQSAAPRKSVFDLSYDKKLTCDMGQLIPIMCDEAVPGDIFKIANELVIRFAPLVAPILHEVNAYIHYFFVPYRLLWTDWENFISGGVTGDYVVAPPTWEPTNTAIGSLWDYLGLPVTIDPDGAYPLDFMRRGYNRIYNEFYRDESLVTAVLETNETILLRAWEKDYFTSAQLNQQRGTAPALPISGITSAEWEDASIQDAGGAPDPIGVSKTVANDILYADGAVALQNLRDFFAANEVDLSVASTFDVADLRLAFQIQKWMERNQRAGARYTEFLKGHFGVSPKDDRLQRPEYLGGMRAGVIVSEVLQTSQTGTTPQANMAGHGMVASKEFSAKYRVEEFGLIMGIMSIMPRSAYQQGIDRQWLRRTKYDFYFPEFANLSEQAIERAEIYASAVAAENTTIFGYQGRYDEMRIKRNMVCGLMRTTYDHWHLGRQFTAAPELNQAFIECVPRKDIFAAPSEPGLIVNCRNIITAIRPMPSQSEPGLIDHG